MHKSSRRDSLQLRLVVLTEEMDELFALVVDLVLFWRSGLLVVGLVVCRRFSLLDGLFDSTNASQFP